MGSILMGLIPMGACNPSVRMGEVVVLMVDMWCIEVADVGMWFVHVIRVIAMDSHWLVPMR